MNTRDVLLISGLSLLLVGCGGDDSSGGANEEQRAQAAASASIITGSLNNPEDPDDDGGGGSLPMGVLHGNNPMSMADCTISGTQTQGSGTEDVGSPFTSAGEVSVSWNEYDNCVEGTSGSEYEFDGYTASGTAESGNVSYVGWSSARGSAIDLNNRFVLDWPDGQWSFAGEMHNCDNCSMGSFNEFEGFMEWEVQAEGETVTFSYGKPNDYLSFSGTGQEGGQVQQTINGAFGIDWAGTPCDFDVNYDTRSPLVINNYGTTSQVTVGGELDLTLGGGSGATYTVTWDQDGNAYLDGDLIDPDEPNPCDGATDVLEVSIGAS